MLLEGLSRHHSAAVQLKNTLGGASMYFALFCGAYAWCNIFYLVHISCVSSLLRVFSASSCSSPVLRLLYATSELCWHQRMRLRPRRRVQEEQSASSFSSWSLSSRALFLHIIEFGRGLAQYIWICICKTETTYNIHLSCIFRTLTL